MLILILYALFQALLSSILSIMGGCLLIYLYFRQHSLIAHFFTLSSPLFAMMPTKLCALAVLSCGFTGMAGIIYAHVLMNMPFAFYAFLLVYQQLDKELIWVSYDLGASSWQTYRMIVLPALKCKAVLLAGIIFVLCFSSVSIPLLIGTSPNHSTLDIYMADAYQSHQYLFFGIATILRLLIIVPIMRWSNKHPEIEQSIVRIQPASYRGNSFVWERVVASIVLLCFAVPLGAIIWAMIKERVDLFLIKMIYAGTLQNLSCTITTIIMRSIVIAAISGIGSVIVSAGIFLLQQYYVIKKNSMTICLYMPLLLGGVFTGIFFEMLIALFGGSSLIAIICSHVFLNYPFVYQMLTRRTGNAYREITLLASSMGATSLQIVQTISLPLLKTSLMRGWGIAFGLSLTEMGACLAADPSACLTISGAIRILRAQGDMQGVLGLHLIVLLLMSGMTWIVTREE